jgi:hypothetical protein
MSHFRNQFFQGRRNKLLQLLFLGVVISVICGCVSGPQESGILEGHVTIGPLVPVLREGEVEPTPAPEVYAAREIVVFEEDGRTEFARLKIDPSGNYRAELPVGTYVVDINRIGIDTAMGLPKEIIIESGIVTKLDIDIDTGIR